MEGEIKKEIIRRYLFIVISVLLVLASYFILKPYLVALLSAFVLAFLIKPIYDYLSRKVGDKSAAWICIFGLILIIVMPLGVVATALINQSYIYTSSNAFEETLNTVLKAVGLEIDSEVLNQINSRALNYFVSLLRPLVSNAIAFLIGLFIMFFGLYYILTKWDYLSDELEKFIPFRDKKQVSKELSSATKEIVFGTFLLGLVEFIVALVGFYFVGVESVWLLSSLIFLAAFIPMFGPGMVWMPVMLYYFVVGNYFATSTIFVIGMIISFGIDVFLRARITGKRNNINPFIMLLGIFGGVGLFGLFGFIIGPLILVYTIRLLREIVE